MRWMLGLSVAALSLATVPAFAGNPMFDQVFGTQVHPALAGDIEIGAGPERYSEDFGFDAASSSHALLEGTGRVNIPLAGPWSFEAEATASSSWESGVTSSAIGAYGHLWTILPGSALGVFGGASTGDITYPAYAYSQPVSADTGTAGIEGEAYFNRLTLGGQVSISNTTFDDGFASSQDHHSWRARGYLSYYLTPDTKLVGDVRYTYFDERIDSTDQERWDFVGTVEHRFAGTPWSIWASGTYSSFSSTVDNNWTGNQWSALVGVRLFTDVPGSTLYRHDREVPFKYDDRLRILYLTII
jgi:hypothetical protein